MDTFVKKIKELRIENKVSQQKLGTIVDLSKQTINDIEHGRSSYSIDKLIKIADYFHVSTDYLLGRTDTLRVEQQPLEVISEIDQEVIGLFNALSDADQNKIVEIMKLWSEMNSKHSQHEEKA